MLRDESRVLADVAAKFGYQRKDETMQKVFLGGTTRLNTWREEIVIPGLLERGVALEQIYNPIVEHWTPADQASEDAAKANPEYLLLFVIASPDPESAEITQVPAYSMVEATRAALVCPERTMILVNTSGIERRAAKGIEKAAQDWQGDAPDMPIFYDYSAMLDALAERLRGAV